MNDDKIPHIEEAQMKKLGEIAEGDYVLRHHRGNWRYLRVDRATRTQITAGGKKIPTVNGIRLRRRVRPNDYAYQKSSL